MTYDPYRQPPRPSWPAQQPPAVPGMAGAYGSYQQPAPLPAPEPPSRHRRWPYAVLAAAFLVLAGSTWVAYDRNVIFKDSGIKACEALRDGNSTFKGDPQDNKPLTEDQYRQLREVFADSRYDDIRDHGTKLMDIVWQMSQATQGGNTEDPEAIGAALAYLQPLATHMTGLQSACADQGIIVNLNPAGN